MTNEFMAGHPGPTNEPKKGAWSTPTLTRIEAGEAEVGTRATGDGGFTTS